jgi:Ricin-type beta-trefoil lectin domain
VPSPTLRTVPPQIATVVAASGLCLDDVSNRSKEGNPIKVWACNGTKAQAWTFGSDTTVRVHGMCLRPGLGQPGPGTPVAIYTCTGSPYEQWLSGPGGALVNAASGLCLFDPTGTVTDRVSVEVCDGATDQHWQLT